MSTQVPSLMFVAYLSPFASWCVSITCDDSGLSTIGNDGCKCSVVENTILSQTEDMYVTKSSDVLMLDSESSGNKSPTWSDFVISMDNHRPI